MRDFHAPLRSCVLAVVAIAVAARLAAAYEPRRAPVATPAGATKAPVPRVELLHNVPSVVAVSSTVANAAIVPEHVVDGDPATAWNSRTGDLVGAWLAFRVPKQAHVDVIMLSAGFTQVDPKLGDLFTMNPRIKKLRVSRNGKVVLEKQLDVASRALQELPVDADGGDFRIEVMAIAPGSKASWREICVSELEVWGTPPPGTAVAKQTPTVRVGSLDATYVLGVRRGADGAATLPLGLVEDGWAYLGFADTDPGKGEVRVAHAFIDRAGPVAVAYDLRRTIARTALPARYRGVEGMKVTVYDARFKPACEGVLGAPEVAIEGEVDRAIVNLDDPTDAGMAAARKRIWEAGPYKIAARVTAPCLDRAAWARSAELPAPSPPASVEPPGWLAAAAVKAFRERATSELSEQQAKLARSPDVAYVAAASGHPAYVAASFQIDLCHPGEFGLWNLWQVDGKQLTSISIARDELAGALDIDGDGTEEVLTSHGEIGVNGYVAWWDDLTPFLTAGLGCDGHD